MSETFQELVSFKTLRTYEKQNDENEQKSNINKTPNASSVNKVEILDTIKRMKKKLSWHKKTEADTRNALEFFDSLHENKDKQFHKMKLPQNPNELRQLKIDLNLLCKRASELCLRNKLNMSWWIDSTDILIQKALSNEAVRAERRASLSSRKSARVSQAQMAEIMEIRQKKSLVKPSQKRGKFKRVTAYQSVHGVPAWPIGHRKGSSMTRVGLELHALRDLQEMVTIQNNTELMEELNNLYEKLYELWETLKTRKLAREAKALIQHKCDKLNPAKIQSEYGCPWAVNEMLEMQQQRLSENKQFNQIRNLKESVHINSPKCRLGQENLSVEMRQLQRISDSMANDAMQREIKHQKASDIQRKSFEVGLKHKQDLQSRQAQLEMQLETDDSIINDLEKDISKMLISINTYKVDLDAERLPKFSIFVPVKKA